MAEGPYGVKISGVPLNEENLSALTKWANNVIKNMRSSGVMFNPDSIRAALGLLRVCKACNNPIRIQIFKGEDWCSDDCRKKLQKEE